MSQGFSLREYIIDQYSISAQIMPDTWMGHAKLALTEKDLPERKKARALRHTRNLVEEKGYPAEVTLETVIDKLD